MLKRIDDLMICVRFCLGGEGHLHDAAESVLSFLTLHLRETYVEIPPLLAPHVKAIEQYCNGGK